MLDPVSIGLAISTASKAFDMIQRGFAVGRELEQMHGDMGRWMSQPRQKSPLPLKMPKMLVLSLECLKALVI
jgi:hypothetical protein